MHVELHLQPVFLMDGHGDVQAIFPWFQESKSSNDPSLNLTSIAPEILDARNTYSFPFGSKLAYFQVQICC